MTRCLRSSSCWVPPRLLHHLPWVLPGQLCFCVWARQAEKHFGSAPCLSRVQHYQGSRLVSSISRCLSLLRSQVSSQDFLARGETECLSEPSRPVFHLQQPGSCLGDGPGPAGQPIPFCSAQEALCISFLALQSKEAPGFHPSPAPWVYCSPRTGSEVALPSKSEQFLPACLQRQECQPRRARPLTVSKSNWDLFRTWSSPARPFQLFCSFTPAWQGCQGLEANGFRKPAEHQAWAGGCLPLSLLRDPLRQLPVTSCFPIHLGQRPRGGCLALGARPREEGASS